MDEIPVEFQPVFAAATAAWSTSRVSILRAIKEGKSGAAVFVVDVEAATASDSPPSGFPRSGEYLLKLDRMYHWDPPEPSERQRHEMAAQQNANFAKEHIPNLVAFHEHGQMTALLYDIAGLTHANLISGCDLNADMLRRCGRILSTALLSDLNRNLSVDIGRSAQDLLHDWLGYRFDAARAPGLHEFVKSEAGDRPILVAGGQVLVNPVWLCQSDIAAKDRSHGRFDGVIHGDLHPSNVLVHRQDADGQRYWLIDFALARKAPLFYDHAYFEIGLLLRQLQGASQERLHAALEAIDAAPGTPEASRVPPSDVGLVACLHDFRDAVALWQQSSQPKRTDAVTQQMLLARVAAGLNWVNKLFSTDDRRIALAYAGRAAREYLAVFHRQAYQALVSGGLQAPVVHKLDTIEWDRIWSLFDGFNPARGRFILIAGGLGSTDDLASLGLLPWSAVIDFDPYSEESGLLSKVRPLLSKLRSVSAFGLKPQPFDVARGTGWVMAGGWPSRFEPVPQSLMEWRRLYGPLLRNLVGQIRQAVAPDPIKLLVLPGRNLSQDMLTRVLEFVDDELKAPGNVALLDGANIDPALVENRFAINHLQFAQHVRAIYGAKVGTDAIQLPGRTGFVQLSVEDLRNLEEDLDVLHSRIMESSLAESRSTDAFWRGNPPDWTDLQAEVDVRRDIHAALVNVLQERLRTAPHSTLSLYHSPGAGGTTAALRAVWELRSQHPAVVVRRYSKRLAARVQSLSQLTQLPILLLAEASVLPASTREELYRDLASRNVRFTILTVVRSTTLGPADELSLQTPISSNEAEQFQKSYAGRTTDQHRHRELGLITRDSRYAPYRSPFFYGLITFDRDFESLDRYVAAHLEGVGYTAGKVLRYLALVTRFSQGHVAEGLMRGLLGQRTYATSELESAFGPGPWRLVLNRGSRYRLMHPLIAEQVLRAQLGSDNETWRRDLQSLTLDFINDVAGIGGGDSEEVQLLFERMFILRDDAGGRGDQFAEIVESLTEAGGQLVFDRLTEVCSRNAHFWNHRGRHRIYRLRERYEEAASDLQTAVGLSPEEATHHHTLGLVRRFWIESILRKLAIKADRLTAGALLNEVKLLAEEAADSFQATRDINPADSFGYITHVQMIIHIAGHLLTAGSGDLSSIGGEAGQWLRRNLVLAEELLQSVAIYRADSPPMKLEYRCTTDLNQMYGNLDSVLAEWESVIRRGEGDADMRTALARGYLVRHGREWVNTPSTTIRRIHELMARNLRERPSDDRDLRLWFDAFRRLPEFQPLEAMDRLTAWAARANSIEPHYYLFMLHFVRIMCKLEP
ncbi:MAG: phosphotransferase, partial [Tepidisphaeraceae bacterium]